MKVAREENVAYSVTWIPQALKVRNTLCKRKVDAMWFHKCRKATKTKWVTKAKELHLKGEMLYE